MSIEAMLWALELPRLSAQQKLLLVNLANHCDESGSCFPSQKLLAARSSCSVRTVQRTLVELQRLGLVSVEHRNFRGGRTSSRYQLPLGTQGVFSAPECPSDKLSLGGGVPETEPVDKSGFPRNDAQATKCRLGADRSNDEAVDKSGFPRHSAQASNCHVGSPSDTGVVCPDDTGVAWELINPKELTHTIPPSPQPPKPPKGAVGVGGGMEREERSLALGSARGSAAAHEGGPALGLSSEQVSLLVSSLPDSMCVLSAEGMARVWRSLAPRLAAGWSPHQVRSQLAMRSLPDPVHDMAALVAARLDDLLDAPLDARAAGRAATAARVVERKRSAAELAEDERVKRLFADLRARHPDWTHAQVAKAVISQGYLAKVGARDG